MNRAEAIKIITKTNKLRRKVDRLTDRLWHEPISGRGFKLCQERLKEAKKELNDGFEEHRMALKAVLGP